MKIGDEIQTNAKGVKNNSINSLAPLKWFLKLFAINCSLQRETAVSPCIIIKNFIAASVSGALSCYCLYYKINHLYKYIVISIQLTDAVQMVYDYFQYLVDLYFVYKYGRHTVLVYFEHYQFIDEILNMQDHTLVKWKLTKLIAVFTIIWSASSSCDFAAWYFSYGWTTPIMYIVSYIFLFIKILTMLHLAGHVMLIEVRLSALGDVLENCYLSASPCPGLITDCLSNKEWLYSGVAPRQGALKSIPLPLLGPCYDAHKEIKSLMSCYLLLTEQVAFINKMHGFRILLNNLSLLIDMVRYTNIAVRIATGSQKTLYNSDYFPAVSSLIRLFTCAAMCISLVDHCEQTYRQKERIINIIDHLLVNKELSPNLQQAVTDMRDLIQQRPITFNMANVLIINYSLLVSIASVVVTYSIILLQSVN